VEFRLRYLAKDRRASECLQAAANKARWQKRVFPALQSNGDTAKGRGIALTRRSGAYVATVVDIELNKASGQIAVKHIVCAHDCGLIVNPDGVRNQIEGNVVQGVSRALFEELTFDGNGVNSLDWKSYPILRFTDLPELDVVLINRTEIAPLGAGEPATIPVAASIGNAIFDAIGVRLYEAPFTPARVMAALQKKA
jgi:nicotinate dehydrogenase subunit B